MEFEYLLKVMITILFIVIMINPLYQRILDHISAKKKKTKDVYLSLANIMFAVQYKRKITLKCKEDEFEYKLTHGIKKRLLQSLEGHLKRLESENKNE